MKSWWYGDGRDLVKWGTAIHLAKVHGLRWILQVAFKTEEPPRPELTCGTARVPLDVSVLAHFRDLRRIDGLSRRSAVSIRVFDEPFTRSRRAEYVAKVARIVREAGERPGLVLLDPDTGLSANPSEKHVSPTEVGALWGVLGRGDWIVLYQHADRTRDWKTRRSSEFRDAIGGADVEIFTVPMAARDVAFFAARRAG